MKEEYRNIEGYSFYQVSNLGNVKSLKFNKERILKPSKDISGYDFVVITSNKKRKTIKIHQLVAMAFLNHKPNGMKIVVDHIDNDKDNNKLSNLQLISHRKNTSKDKNGASKYTGVSKFKKGNKWVAHIRINSKSKYLGLFNCELAAAHAYNKALKNELCN